MTLPAKKSPELPVLSFPDQAAWTAWLHENHDLSPGAWLLLIKKSAALGALNYDQALEAALCYGWIDGQKQRHDERAWLQKFTPRGPRSIWSQVNTEKAQRLIDAGRMQPAGLQAVEAARQDGRWQAAYQPQRSAVVPADLQAGLDADPAARAFFESLDSRNRYAILFRLGTAKKPETRSRRLAQFLEMLSRGEKIYP